MDGSLFRVLRAQLKFGTLLHKSALSPYLSDQTVSTIIYVRQVGRVVLGTDTSYESFAMFYVVSSPIATSF